MRGKGQSPILFAMERDGLLPYDAPAAVAELALKRLLGL